MQITRQKTAQAKISVMLAEDHALVRQGFVAILSREPHLQVIGEADNGRELINLVKATPPDVVLLDIDMPIMNGKETLDILKKRYPGVKVVMLTMHASASYMHEFMSRGADAFLSKTCDPSLLTEAIEAVVNGRKSTDPGITEATPEPVHVPSRFDVLSLTARETNVLKQVCEGKTNKEISDACGISENTVEFHRRNIYSKTHSKSITDLVKYAVKNGIITIA